MSSNETPDGWAMWVAYPLSILNTGDPPGISFSTPTSVSGDHPHLGCLLMLTHYACHLVGWWHHWVGGGCDNLHLMSQSVLTFVVGCVRRVRWSSSFKTVTAISLSILARLTSWLRGVLIIVRWLHCCSCKCNIFRLKEKALPVISVHNFTTDGTAVLSTSCMLSPPQDRGDVIAVCLSICSLLSSLYNSRNISVTMMDWSTTQKR